MSGRGGDRQWRRGGWDSRRWDRHQQVRGEWQGGNDGGRRAGGHEQNRYDPRVGRGSYRGGRHWHGNSSNHRGGDNRRHREHGRKRGPEDDQPVNSAGHGDHGDGRGGVGTDSRGVIGQSQDHQRQDGSGRAPRRARLEHEGGVDKSAVASPRDGSSSAHAAKEGNDKPRPVLASANASPSPFLRTAPKSDADTTQDGAGVGAASSKSENDLDGGGDSQSHPTEAEWEEAVLSCYRFPPAREQLPMEAFHPDPEDWVQKKKEAAEHAIGEVMRNMRSNAEREIREEREEEEDCEDDDASDSSGDQWGPYGGGGRRSSRPEDRFPYRREQVEKFFRALVRCFPLTMGFDVFGVRSEDDKNCHCACDANLLGWRERFGLEGTVAGKDSCSYCTKGKLTPIGLMSHVRKEAESCTLHYGLVCYLERLYSKDIGEYRGGIGHKAMYQLNDKNWKRADAAEKRDLNEEIWARRKQLAEERARRQELEAEREQQEEQLKLLQRTSKEHYERIQELERDREALHVKKKEAPPELSSSTLKRYRTSIEAFFRTAKNAAKADNLDKKADNLDKLVLKVEQEFSLQDFFDKYYAKSGNKTSASLLFGNLDGRRGNTPVRNLHGPKIVNEWDVQFRNEARNRGAAKEDKAVDEGGPTREFLSQCWRQMGSVTLKVGGINVKLFDIKENGCVPVQDDTLREAVRAAVKKNGGQSDEGESEGFLERAKSYYRAFGRIMLHSLANGHTIAASAMPPLYINWLLRGCSPKDEDYHREDVLKHIMWSSEKSLRGYVGYEHEFADGSKEKLTADSIFTKLIPEQYLESMEQCLKHIEEGLTQDGTYLLRDFLRSVPLEAVQKIAFSKPDLSADDIISVLTPRYCEGWKGSEVEKLDQKEVQKAFFDDLCDILKERGETNPEYLSLFVRFCTGYDYIPYSVANDFEILVEFNFAESAMGAHPVAHTCVKTLKLPGHLYSRGRDEFESKLDEAVLVYCNRFDMR